MPCSDCCCGDNLRFEEELISLSSSQNIYVLAYREWDYMDILNFDDISQSAGNLNGVISNL